MFVTCHFSFNLNFNFLRNLGPGRSKVTMPATAQDRFRLILGWRITSGPKHVIPILKCSGRDVMSWGFKRNFSLQFGALLNLDLSRIGTLILGKGPQLVCSFFLFDFSYLPVFITSFILSELIQCVCSCLVINANFFIFF